MSLPAWDKVQRILCVRLDHIGDVLMTTPALRALKQAMPGRHITLLTSPGGASVAPYVPEIDDTIVYSAPWMKSSDTHEAQTDLALIARLASGNFDAAVIFTVYSQNPLPAAMLCYLAGIPLRLAHCHENPYQLLTHWVPDPEPHERIRHEVQRQLDLVANVNAQTDDMRLSFCISDTDRAFVRSLLQALGIDAGQPWLLLHPGATAPSRRYPAEQWNAAAHMLTQRLQFPLVFTGSEPEAALIDKIRQDLPDTCSLAGQLSLGQLAAFIAQAPLLLSNNTGPAHIAAAVGTPVVDLYALTNPQHTPWMVPHRLLFHDVPCRNCYKSVCPEGHHDCLTRVTPSRVADAAIELLQEHKLRQPDQPVNASTVLAHS